MEAREDVEENKRERKKEESKEGGLLRLPRRREAVNTEKQLRLSVSGFKKVLSD